MATHALATAWKPIDENLALLVDRLDYWLSAEYSQWVTDPDDPEVKKDREERKRQGIKPSPVPIIPPVAIRPTQRHKAAQRRAELLRQRATTQPSSDPKTSTKRRISIAELRQASN